MTITVSPLVLTIKQLREERGLTQSDLAEKVGVRQATISDLETGKSRRIELDLLERLARALRVSPGELLQTEPARRGR